MASPALAAEARSEVAAAADELDHAQLQGGADEPEADESERAGAPRAATSAVARGRAAVCAARTCTLLSLTRRAVLGQWPGGYAAAAVLTGANVSANNRIRAARRMGTTTQVGGGDA
jgi:hypothetical protein